MAGTPLDLSRRERQLLEVIYRLGKATAAEIMESLPNAPTYTTVRGLLRVLESKGHVQHEQDGARYVYSATMTKQRAAKSVLRHVLSTFFDDSPSQAMAALLGSEQTISEDELDRLAALVKQARKKEKK